MQEYPHLYWENIFLPGISIRIRSKILMDTAINNVR